MRHYAGYSLLILSLFVAALPAAAQDVDIESRIDAILQNMTLDEKIGQTAMRGTSSRDEGSLSNELIEAVRSGRIGTMLNVTDRDIMDELQRIAVEESAHGIPIIFSRDVIHGYKTIFPIPLGLAATWNPDIVEEGARISAEEATTQGIRWTFAPAIDITRDPRWGRIAESPGEDPYLGSVLARAYVRGFQGDDLTDTRRMAATAKHFAAYGAAEGGRDYNTASLSENVLRDIYLPPFEAAIEEGVATFMTSFNDVNGVPATGSRYLLQNVLRGEWGFDGLVVSDWESVTEMIAHGFAADDKDAARLAANAGVDVEMTSRTYEDYLHELIDEGAFSEAQLDELVRNILRVKLRLGLFENPYIDRSRDDVILSDAHLAASREAAVQSFVLLENHNERLPLSKDVSVAVIGPLADAPHEQLGTWTFDGDESHSRTPLDAITELLGEERVRFAPALDYSRERDTARFDDAVAAAAESDVVLFFGGEEAILSGEAHSRANIDLPGAQEALIHRLAETGKPIVLVVMAGRPITLGNVLDHVDAVLMAWHPGTMAGPALADVLFGDAEPQGRLPVTWPKVVGQVPIYYNHPNTGRPPDDASFVHMDDIPIKAWQSSLGNTSHYLDAGFTPQYFFGYGLGYTTFGYDNLQLSADSMPVDGGLTVRADVTNTGDRRGTEVVQLYVRDLVGDIVRPVRELKGFRRITLDPGETTTVEFVLDGAELSFHNQLLERVTEPGEFHVWIGPNAAEGLQGSFYIR